MNASSATERAVALPLADLPHLPSRPHEYRYGREGHSARQAGNIQDVLSSG